MCEYNPEARNEICAPTDTPSCAWKPSVISNEKKRARLGASAAFFTAPFNLTSFKTTTSVGEPDHGGGLFGGGGAPPGGG